MQQTVDVTETTDVSVETTILVSGLSYSFCAVVTALVQVADAVDVDAATIAVSGLSSYCSAVADSVMVTTAANLFPETT